MQPQAVFGFCFFFLFLVACQGREEGSVGRPISGAFRVCTQNLHRFGVERKKKFSQKMFRSHRDAFVSRFLHARCDIIALQEAGGSSQEQTRAKLEDLAAKLGKRAKVKFRVYTGESNDPDIRNAFLVSERFAPAVERKEFNLAPLPKLQPFGPTSYFSRGPLMIRLPISLEAGGRSAHPRQLVLITLHLKSKAGAWKDPTSTLYESLRMEMAARVADEIRELRESFQEDSIIVVLGDRNSGEASASAELLRGRRRLSDFSLDGDCRIKRDLSPECSSSKLHPSILQGLFSLRKALFPGRYPGGSYRYKGREYQLDEILLSTDFLWLVCRRGSTLAIGYDGTMPKASDHRLLWAEFDFSRSRNHKRILDKSTRSLL